MEKPSDKPASRLRQKLAAALQHSKTSKADKQKKLLRKKKDTATQGDPLWSLYEKAKARGKALQYSSCCGAITIRGEKADLSHHKAFQVPISALIGKDPCLDAESLSSRIEDALQDTEGSFPYLLIGSSHLEAKYDRLHFKMMMERKDHKEKIARLEAELLLLKQSQKLGPQGEESSTQSSVGKEFHEKIHDQVLATERNESEEQVKLAQENS